MATVIDPSQFHERRNAERRRIAHPLLLRADGVRVSWGGIWGGVLVALGVLLLAGALGVAVGISAVDPAQTDARILGTGAAIWGAVSLLIALFLGGLVSTRIGAIHDRATGFFEGALVWIVSVLLTIAAASSGLGMLAGSASGYLGGAVAQMQSQPGQAINRIEQKAQEVKPKASAAAWIAFGGLVISLFAAVAGAAAGRRTYYPTSRGT